MKVSADVKFQMQIDASVPDDSITSIARQNAINQACAGKNLDGRQMDLLSRSAVVKLTVDINRPAGSRVANVSVKGHVEGSYQ